MALFGNAVTLPLIFLTTTFVGCASRLPITDAKVQTSSRVPAEASLGTELTPDGDLLYIPSSARDANSASPRPLIVAIHGCMQNAKSMAEGSRLNAEAERLGFNVLYPNQRPNRNPYNCWRWFEEENQREHSGEIAEILELIETAKRTTAIDPKKIFVTGISSGAAMAGALLACHPETFAGGALHAGPAYGSAKNAEQGLSVMKSGPAADFAKNTKLPCSPARFSGKLVIVQGSHDAFVHARNAETLIEEFTTKALRKTHRESMLPTTKSNAYETRVACYGPMQNICLVAVSGLGHAWSGGITAPFFDPKGPNMTVLVPEFFLSERNPFLAQP